MNQDHCKIVIYEQAYALDGSIPSSFLDPNVLLSHHSFSVQPGETVVAVVLGSGYRGMDSHIYPLRQHDDGNTFVASPPHQCVCYLITNNGDLSIHVGKRAKLKYLLQLTFVIAKLCYASHAEMSVLKVRSIDDLENEDENNNEKVDAEMLMFRPQRMCN
jgi:hypothetical protein